MVVLRLFTYLLVPVELPLSLPLGVGLVPMPPVGAFEGVALGDIGAADDDESVAGGADGVAGAVLTGAESLGVLVVGAGGVASFFLHPARAANTTAVANTVLRINIGLPL
ncbi:MAG TPA: hypothetical protein VNX00_08335 [Herbaspirillum sp.]|nr:hypothetical protein [Herbaspirillum sp.]